MKRKLLEGDSEEGREGGKKNLGLRFNKAKATKGLK